MAFSPILFWHMPNIIYHLLAQVKKIGSFVSWIVRIIYSFYFFADGPLFRFERFNCLEVETCRSSRLADLGTHSTSAWCEAAKRGLDGKNWFELSCLSVHWKWRTKKKYFYGKGRLQRETLAELYPLVSCAPTCINPPDKKLFVMSPRRKSLGTRCCRYLTPHYNCFVECQYVSRGKIRGENILVLPPKKKRTCSQ